MNKNVNYYDVEFDSEDICVMKLNYLAKLETYIFQCVITDDDDETYIPKLDFEYDICDCASTDLTNGNIWKKFLESEKPIIFINTSEMFEQYKDCKFLDTTFKDGRQGWANMFYFFQRDRFWESKAKYIFLISEENYYALHKSCNAGFTILLESIHMQKNKHNKSQEKPFVKTFKKQNFPDILK